jgi:hypothetical protein
MEEIATLGTKEYRRAAEANLEEEGRVEDDEENLRE